MRAVDVTAPENADFALAMNRGNCLAYDGTVERGPQSGALGMPRWVMLDCCALPSAVFGLEVPRDAVPKDLADAMDPTGRLEWIGVTEYIALPSVAPGEVVGVSLFSLVAGRRLGSRTKAMTLRLMGAATQTGVTQWTGAGIKLHLQFGPLRVVSSRVAVHDRPSETFVYQLPVPPQDCLARIERGEAWDAPMPSGERLSLDPRSADVAGAIAEHARGRETWLCGAGAVTDTGLDRLDFVFVASPDAPSTAE